MISCDATEAIDIAQDFSTGLSRMQDTICKPMPSIASFTLFVHLFTCFLAYLHYGAPTFTLMRST